MVGQGRRAVNMATPAYLPSCCLFYPEARAPCSIQTSIQTSILPLQLEALYPGTQIYIYPCMSTPCQLCVTLQTVPTPDAGYGFQLGHNTHLGVLL